MSKDVQKYVNDVCSLHYYNKQEFGFTMKYIYIYQASWYMS